MTEDMVIQMGTEAIKTVVLLGGPILIATMVVGLLVSVFQAVTQVNEQTLTFIPKMIAVAGVLAVMSPWMLKVLQEYAISIFGGMNTWIR